jgi:hypothetical protein
MEHLGQIQSVKDAAQDVSELGWFIGVEVSPFSGYSGVYTQDVVEEIDNAIRSILENKIGFLNDKLECNWWITREDFKAMKP